MSLSMDLDPQVDIDDVSIATFHQTAVLPTQVFLIDDFETGAIHGLPFDSINTDGTNGTVTVLRQASLNGRYGARLLMPAGATGFASITNVPNWPQSAPVVSVMAFCRLALAP